MKQYENYYHKKVESICKLDHVLTALGMISIDPACGWLSAGRSTSAGDIVITIERIL